MSKVFRNLLILGVILTVLTGSFVLSGCSNYEFNEEDFRLTVEVDKTQARVGDTVTITATFENLSGQDVRVRYRSVRGSRFDENRISIFIRCLASGSLEFPVLNWVQGGPRTIDMTSTIRTDAVFVRTIEFTTTEAKVYNVLASIRFSLRNSERTEISLETVTEIITIGEILK